jgi:hypothetical protein
METANSRLIQSCKVEFSHSWIACSQLQDVHGYKARIGCLKLQLATVRSRAALLLASGHRSPDPAPQTQDHKSDKEYRPNVSQCCHGDLGGAPFGTANPASPKHSLVSVPGNSHGMPDHMQRTLVVCLSTACTLPMLSAGYVHLLHCHVKHPQSNCRPCQGVKKISKEHLDRKSM